MNLPSPCKKLLFCFTGIALAFSAVTSLADQTTTTSPVAAAPTAPTPQTLIPPAPSLNAKGYVLMDANSGKIIAQKNMNERLQPASLTKLMTLYIISQALHNGQIKVTDKVRVSKDAWKTGGSRMFLKLGSHVEVQNLIDGIIIASGNDATVAMADYIAGTQQNFATLMNQTAQQLGMKNSHFVDPTGLPKPQHYTTPHDLAVLARAIITHFPEYYGWYKQKWITWNKIRQPNRNRLLWRDPDVDGMKTGHTKEAGYCLIASGKRNGMRLISVVMGTPSDAARTNDSQALLNWGFRFYESHKLYNANQTVLTPRVWLGKNKHVNMGVAQPVYLTIPAGQLANVKRTVVIANELRAPITQGQAYGQLKITLNGQVIQDIPLIALQNDPKGGIWTRSTDHIAMLFKRWF